VAGALIVIEIAAPKVSSDALAVLVSACSRAARDAECVLARNANDEQPAAVAIVTLQTEDKMRVEVGVRQGARDSWRTKEFAFLAADKTMDRWRAVGFAIGTLAESSPQPEEETSTRASAPAGSAAAGSASKDSAAASSAAAGSAAAGSASKDSAAAGSASKDSAAVGAPTSADRSRSTVPPPVVVQPVTSTRPSSSDRRSPGTQMFVGAAVIFGPGLDIDPPWRVGTALYADLALPRAPVFLTLGGSAATRLGASAADVTTRWFDVSLGAGLPLLGPLQGSGLELRAQVFAEYFDAHAGASGSPQTMSRWTLGLQGGFGGRLQIVPDLLLTAELQAAGLSGDTEVKVRGEPVGSSASFRYLGSVGLRVRLR
jgi:hypothetical protein